MDLLSVSITLSLILVISLSVLVSNPSMVSDKVIKLFSTSFIEDRSWLKLEPFGMNLSAASANPFAASEIPLKDAFALADLSIASCAATPVFSKASTTSSSAASNAVGSIPLNSLFAFAKRPANSSILPASNSSTVIPVPCNASSSFLNKSKLGVRPSNAVFATSAPSISETSCFPIPKTLAACCI